MTDGDDTPREPTEGWARWQPIIGAPYPLPEGTVIAHPQRTVDLAARVAELEDMGRAKDRIIAELVVSLQEARAALPKGGTPVPVAGSDHRFPVAARSQQPAGPPPWGTDTRGMGE